MGRDRGRSVKKKPGAQRDDDRPVMSGVKHMLECGRRWQDSSSKYAPTDKGLKSLETVGAGAASGRASLLL